MLNIDLSAIATIFGIATTIFGAFVYVITITGRVLALTTLEELSSYDINEAII